MITLHGGNREGQCMVLPVLFPERSSSMLYGGMGM